MPHLKIISTIGPSSSSRDSLAGLRDAGVDVFRVNMSHASIEDIEKYWTLGTELGITIALDTEGAQIRTTSKLQDPLELIDGDLLALRSFNSHAHESEVANYALELNLLNLEEYLKVGDILRLDFNGALVQLVKHTETGFLCECVGGGLVDKNKGVDLINRSIDLNDFTDKDITALKLSRELGISDIFISFCKSKRAIEYVRNFIPDSFVTSKVESRASIHALEEICTYSDAILIDRGDLSREISILDIPFAQRGIIKMATLNNTPCYVATNVLDSLINGELPTRAELNDIVSTLEMGASGIVLAAETAIGCKPRLCVEIVRELMHKLNLYKSSLLFGDLDRNEITDPSMKIWLNRSFN